MCLVLSLDVNSKGLAETLCVFSGAAGGDMQVAGVMIPLLKFYFHEEVRSAAAQSLPELLRAAVLASGKGQTPSSSVQQLLDALWQPLIDAIQKVRFPCF